ncbi:YopJ family acetyltransferase [Xanthomonas dyei]
MRSQPAWNPYASFDTGAASSHPQALQERAQDSRTSQPVTEAINALRQIKARFAALLDGNWTPGEEEKIFDAVVIPTLIAAESARKPGSPLTLLDTSKELGQWLRKSIPASGKRAVAVLPGYEEHAVAVDVRIIGGRRSVFIIDPLGTDPDPEVSPHFFLRDQVLAGPGCGRRCAHGARFKVTKPEKSADHARQRSIAEVPVSLTLWHACITSTRLAWRG